MAVMYCSLAKTFSCIACGGNGTLFFMNTLQKTHTVFFEYKRISMIQQRNYHEKLKLSLVKKAEIIFDQHLPQLARHLTYKKDPVEASGRKLSLFVCQEYLEQ